jgi:hypothetical protein
MSFEQLFEATKEIDMPFERFTITPMCMCDTGGEEPQRVRGSEPRSDMSSLAAAQADGYYHPPEWDPQKGSLRKFTKSKGSNQYEQSGKGCIPSGTWCFEFTRLIILPCW